MSHRHLIYVSQSESALLTQQDAAGSCSPWVPLSPPATFPQNKLNSQPVGVQLIFFSNSKKSLILFVSIVCFFFFNLSRKAELHSCRPYQIGAA